jgi:signal transducing adaptor molecule
MFIAQAVQLLISITVDYKFEAPMEPQPPAVEDEVRRKEEEELQRVLELSVQDKGGRSQWEAYSLASSSGASGSGSGSSTAAAASSSSRQTRNAPPASSGYVPITVVPTPVYTSSSAMIVQEPPFAAKLKDQIISPSPVSPKNASPAALVSRVRALHTFEPTEQGELAFEKGDVIKVVDRGYKDWWRGQLKGRTGIFPVNYVVSGITLASWNAQTSGPIGAHA